MGFSVIELMIVVAIVGTLSILAAPSFTRMVVTARVKTAASDLHIALLKARSQAVKSNAQVTITCSDSCTGACTPTDDRWGKGWSVTWNDPNDSPDGGTLTLLTHEASEGVCIESAVSSITFLRSGRASGNAAPTFTLTADKATQCREVKLNIGGTPSIRRTECPP